MCLSAHIRRLSRYSTWANRRLMDACRAITPDAYFRDRGAYFGSLHGTLNHILVADRIWLARIGGTDPAVASLDSIVCPDLETLAAEREQEDVRITALADRQDDATLERPVVYRTLAGVAQRTPLSWVLLHMLNHATHHRGQAHGLLSQVPVDSPSLDLVVHLRELGDA